jgi:RND superfamily putative drug exporter
VRCRVPILIATALMLLASGTFGVSVLDRLKGGGLADPESESTVAAARLADDFAAGPDNLVLLVRARTGTVDDPAVATEATTLATTLAGEPGVSNVVSYWGQHVPQMRSTDHASALILARIDGEETEALRRLTELKPAYEGVRGAIEVRTTGPLEIQREIEAQIQEDLPKAEGVAMSVTLILLVLIFGAVVAAALPILVGLIAIVATLGGLRLLTGFTDVSVFALNLTTALGIALGIDYTLLVVARYREELAAGHAPHDAVIRTVRTAGRTIVYSGATVAVSLAALLIFPQFFFRSFAYAGIGVTLVAVVASVVVLPALLAVLGTRVEKFSVRRRRSTAEQGRRWYKLAHRVMRRPLLVATPIVVALALLAVPFGRVEFGLIDHNVLPTDAHSRQVSEQIGRDFPGEQTAALHVVVPDAGDPAGYRTELADYATRLSGLTNVSRVETATGVYADGEQIAPAPADRGYAIATGVRLTVVPEVAPMSVAAGELVRAVRATAAPAPLDQRLVGGQAAELVDAKESVGAHVPWALGLIGVVTFILLFLMLGSVVLPLKAILLNLLSLTALYGTMVWIFQDGHLSSLLGFTPTGYLSIAIPVLMFCMAFGLSMDYEVFLMSRIKEEYARLGDNDEAVARGLQRTAGLITASAAVMAIVFAAFATSGVVLIKMFGLGVLLAVVVDAIVIRSTLVPAFMRLMGAANWWAPRPLRAVHRRFGLHEHEPAIEPAKELTRV